MNLLPTMLIATTLIGGNANIQADISADISAGINDLLNSSNSMNTQVIIGDSSNMDSILGDLGVALDSIKDCVLPEKPETENPGTDKPDTEIPAPELPGNPPENPDQNVPGSGTETPGTETPDTDKPGTDIPGTGTPGTDKPDTETPGNDNNNDAEQDTSKSYVEQVVVLVNAERAKVNLPALTMSEDLNKAALIRAKETTQSFSHTRPNGTSFSSVLAENGISYRGAGENIAWGQRTPEAVVTAWMNSEGHRANILNAKYTTIGVGYYQNASQTPYWVQLFTY